MLVQCVTSARADGLLKAKSEAGQGKPVCRAGHLARGLHVQTSPWFRMGSNIQGECVSCLVRFWEGPAPCSLLLTLLAASFGCMQMLAFKVNVGRLT